MTTALLTSLLGIAFVVGDQVWTPDGWKGEIVETNRHQRGVLLHVRGGGRDGWYWAADVRRV